CSRAAPVRTRSTRLADGYAAREKKRNLCASWPPIIALMMNGRVGRVGPSGYGEKFMQPLKARILVVVALSASLSGLAAAKVSRADEYHCCFPRTGICQMKEYGDCLNRGGQIQSSCDACARAVNYDVACCLDDLKICTQISPEGCDSIGGHQPYGGIFG